MEPTTIFRPQVLRVTRLTRRGLAALLIAALLITAIPSGMPPLSPRVAHADPGTFIQAYPRVFSSWGGATDISWDYQYSHPTIIRISLNGQVVYEIRGTYGPGISHFTWDGRTDNGPAEDGSYQITVIPDDEWSQYAVSTYVAVFNPPPQAPELGGLDPDLEGGFFALHGNAEPGSALYLYLDDTEAEELTVPSSGSWQYYFYLSPDTKHTLSARSWARGKYGEFSQEIRVLHHEVAPGEVLSQIADYYLQNGGDTSAIRLANGLYDDALTAGWHLLILDPVRTGQPTETTYLAPGDGTSIGPYSGAGLTPDPINTSTGAFLYQYTDSALAGKMPLQVQRSYTSGDPYDGPLGYGWHFTYDVRIVSNRDGSLDLFRGTGRRSHYAKGHDGRYYPDQGNFDRLVKNPDGSFTLQRFDHTTPTFNVSGLLTTIADRSGNRLSLSYDKGYLLSQVQSSTGAYLRFTHDTDGRISAATDWAGRTWRYAYDGRRNLVAVTQPDGTAWRYDYDDDHRLTKITGPRDFTQVTNEYDASGRVVRQLDARGLATTVEYDPAHHRTIFADPAGARVVDTYDDHDRLVSRTDALGHTEYFSYDSQGNIASHTDANGRTAFYEHDPGGHLTAIRDPLIRVTSFAYSQAGDLAQIADPARNVTTLTYDSQSNLTGITDPTGATSSFGYDASGNLVRAVDPLGAVTRLAYDRASNPVSLTDPLGNTFTFTFDAAGNAIASAGPDGATTRIARDWAGHPTSVVDPSGGKTTFAYDPQGNVSSITGPSGATYTYGYDVAGNLVQVIDPLNQVTTMEYDARGRMTKKVAPGGATTTYSYDPAGRLVRMSDPVGAVTLLEYDPAGNLTRITDPNQGAMTLEYDPLNRPMKLRDQSGGEVTLTYDAAGRLASRTDQLGDRTTYAYDAAGRLTSGTYPAGGTTALDYDLAGGPVSVKLPNGGIYRYEYSGGKPVKITDPLGRAIRSDYDPLGRATRVLDALGHSTSYAYTAAGDVGRITDPNGHSTTYEYDLLRRLTRVVDAAGGVTTYGYSPFGLASVTDPMGHTTRYDRDRSGHLLAVTNPLGQTTRFGYDPKGNVIWRTDPDGQKTSFSYTPRDLLARISYADGTAVSFGYDLAGRRTEARGPEGLNRYAYDPLGRVVTALDSAGRHTAYTYSPTGKRTGITYPDGRQVKYDYDLADRLRKVTDWAGQSVSLGYDAAGELVGKDFPGGLSSTYTYTTLGQLAGIASFNSRGELAQGFEYRYDPAGNTVLRRLLGGDDDGAGTDADTTAYAYDPLDRLIQATEMSSDGSAVKETRDYSYDPAGNRVALVERGPDGLTAETVEYRYNAANQLVSLTKSDGDLQRFQYDVRGNLAAVYGHEADSSQEPQAEQNPQGVQDELLASYTFDAANRLAAFTDQLGQTASFAYDAEGRRTKRVQTLLWRGPGKGKGKALGRQPGFVPPGQQGKVQDGVEQWNQSPGQDKESLPKPAGGVSAQGVAGGGISGIGSLGDTWLQQFSSLDAGSSLVRVAAKDTTPPEKSNSNGPGGGGNGNGNGNGNSAGNGNGGGNKPDNPGNHANDNAGHGQGKALGKDAIHGPGGDSAEHRNEGDKPQYYAETLKLINDLADPLSPVLVAQDDRSADVLLNLWAPTDLAGEGVAGLGALAGGNLLRTGNPAEQGWALADALGSVTGLMGGEGKVALRVGYDEFGRPHPERRFDPTFPNGTAYFGYTGQPYDYATGFNYLRTRQYAPTLGRFVSPDPLTGSASLAGAVPQAGTTQLAASLNSYLYALNNPLRWVDPLGLSPTDTPQNTEQWLAEQIAAVRTIGFGLKAMFLTASGSGLKVLAALIAAAGVPLPEWLGTALLGLGNIIGGFVSALAMVSGVLEIIDAVQEPSLALKMIGILEGAVDIALGAVGATVAISVLAGAEQLASILASGGAALGGIRLVLAVTEFTIKWHSQ